MFTPAPVRFSAEPDATSKSLPAAPRIVRLSPATAGARVTFVPPRMNTWPTFWVGMLVAVVVAPLLNCSTSSIDGVSRVGVQFVATCHDAEPVLFQL